MSDKPIRYKMEETEDGTTLYNVPFPVVTITVGFGGGSQNLGTGVETITTIVENVGGNYDLMFCSTKCLRINLAHFSHKYMNCLSLRIMMLGILFR
jgi:hypothetical protein